MRKHKFRQWIFIFIVFSLIVALDLVREQKFMGEKGAITLHVLYTSEKKGWIDDVAPEFPQWFKQRHPNLSVKLSFEVQGTRSSMISILSGESKPAIWSPASSVFIPLFKWAWEKKFNSQIFNETEVSSLVSSPIVLGVWKSYKEKHNITAWSDLYTLANEDLKFAHTSAQESNSGFMAVILEVAAATHKPPSQLTLEDLQNKTVQDWLRHVESRAVLYGTSTGFLAKQAVQVGPGALNVIVVYENLIIETARGGEAEAKWNDSLIAVYPKEGTLWSDHPIVIFDKAPWVSKEELLAAREFKNYLLSKKIQLRAVPFGFRPGNQSLINDPEVISAMKDIFKPELGIQFNITIPTFTPPQDGELLDRIPDLWLTTRATNLKHGDADHYQLACTDWCLYSSILLVATIFVKNKNKRRK